jgi:diketogulonate reductase-like aldo/keto reductase
MPIQKITKLNTGAFMPLIGLGTYFLSHTYGSQLIFLLLGPLQELGSPNQARSSMPSRPHSGMATNTSTQLPRMVSALNEPLNACIRTSSHRLGNEKEVGQGIKASGVPRSEIFLTTKLDNIDHADVLGALNKSLGFLGTDYVDLCAGPSPYDDKICL